MKKLKFHRTLFHVNLRADISCFLCCAQQFNQWKERKYWTVPCERMSAQSDFSGSRKFDRHSRLRYRVNVNHVAKRKGTRANSNQNQFPLHFLHTFTFSYVYPWWLEVIFVSRQICFLYNFTLDNSNHVLRAWQVEQKAVNCSPNHWIYFKTTMYSSPLHFRQSISNTMFSTCTD